MIPITLAVEDPLSRDVGLRIISHADSRFQVQTPILGGGFGRLKSNCRPFNQMAQWQPVVLITDLDRGDCPRTLVENWLAGLQQSPNFLLRVVIREIESWLLADRNAIADFLDCPLNKVPNQPEQCANPKTELLRLAEKYSPKKLSRAITRRVKTDLLQGFEYNEVLGDFVLATWDPIQAAKQSDSLTRAIHRLRELAARQSTKPAAE